MTDARNVQAPRRDIGCYENLFLTLFELLQQIFSHYIIAERSLLPLRIRPIVVIPFGNTAEELVLESYESIWTMERARQEVRDAASELAELTDDPWMAAGSAVARATIRPNFSNDIISC